MKSDKLMTSSNSSSICKKPNVVCICVKKDIEYLMDFTVISTGDELRSHVSKYCLKGLCKTAERSTKSSSIKKH